MRGIPLMRKHNSRPDASANSRLTALAVANRITSMASMRAIIVDISKLLTPADRNC